MNRLRQLFSRRRLYRELSEEIQAHLDEKIEELVAQGMSREEAMQCARREFGNVGVVEENCREVWGWPSVESVLLDVRFGLRALTHSPVFTAVALLTIAIGIGANAAVFTVVNSVLLRPLPYPKPEELVALHQVAPGAEGLTDFENGLLLSPSMYFTYAEHNQTFQSLGVWITGTANVTGFAEPEQVRTVGVSDGVLEAFSLPPAAGRWLLPTDQALRGPERAMLSYSYWQRRFGGSPTVVGRNILLDSRPREIVGVMPKGFQFVDADFDVVVPLAFDRNQQILAGFGYHGIARLKSGATIAEANADIARMLPIWMDSWSNGPGTNPHIYETWKITPMIRPLKQEVLGNIGELLWVVMGTLGVVMLIACANVANLLLVRVEARQQELGVRAALGAGWARIVRGLLVESLMLGLAGGVVGVGLAYAGVRFLVATGPSNLPRLSEVSLDARTLGFTLILSLLSGLFFGLFPALKYAGGPRGKLALRSAERTAGASRERHRTRNLLVVGQVAMALVLMVSAGLMIRTFEALRTVDPGFSDPQHLQLVRISIPDTLVADPERVARIQNEILDKLAAVQGVKSAGFVSEMPMEGFDSNWDEIFAQDKVYASNTIAPLRLYKYMSPGMLPTAGTRLVAGRDITWSEVYGLRRVVMVSENLAREMWGTPSAAIGKHLREYPKMPWHEVIGVIQDVREMGLEEKAPEIVYWPPLMENVAETVEAPARAVTFAIRSERAGTESFLKEIREAVWSVNSNLPLASVRTMQDVYDKSMARTSFTLVMLGIAGTMALGLGIIGIYGVMSYTVSQRQREIGIRLALGAQGGDLLQMVLRQGTELALVGVAIGISAALVLTRLMTHLLFSVTPHDPLTFVAVSVLLLLVTLLACYLPARGATLVDPMVALRDE
jgi:predicted permease